MTSPIPDPYQSMPIIQTIINNPEVSQPHEIPKEEVKVAYSQPKPPHYLSDQEVLEFYDEALAELESSLQASLIYKRDHPATL
jgi:hypothetical protein